MNLLKLTIAATLLAASSSQVALADTAAAETCAATLSADSKAIYAAVAPGVTADSVLPDIVRDATIGLVMAGTLDRDNARPAAEAAGACLVHLKG